MLLSFGLLIPINSALLPIKMTMDGLHLSNSVIGLGILYAAVQIPMSVMILSTHVSGIDKAIDEAARIDGAEQSARSGVDHRTNRKTGYCYDCYPSGSV